MRLKDVILLSLSAAMIIVGAHLTMTKGILVSYPIFMVAITLFFWFKFRKAGTAQNKGSEEKAVKKNRNRRK